MKVKQVMTKDPVTVTPDTPLKRVAGILAAHGFSGLPVVGPAGEPLGVVSEADFLVKGTEPALEPRRTLGRRLRFRRGDACGQR